MNDQSRAKYDSLKRKEASGDEQRRWRADFEAKLKASAEERHEQANKQVPTSSNETNIQDC